MTRPLVDVVVRATDASYEDACATVEGILAGTVSDVRVSLVGPWSRLDSARRTVLDDPLLDLRLLHESFRCDPRVAVVESEPETAVPVPFRLVCPPGWVPALDAVERLVALADDHGCGRVTVRLPGEEFRAEPMRLERTAGFAGARRLHDADVGPGAPVDAVDSIVVDYEDWAIRPPETDQELEASHWGWDVLVTRWKTDAEYWQRRASEPTAPSTGEGGV